MTEPIYFTIREQKYTFDDENSKIAKKFNTKISQFNYKVDLLKKYASDVIVDPFLAELEMQFQYLLKKWLFNWINNIRILQHAQNLPRENEPNKLQNPFHVKEQKVFSHKT
jgi:hypothetical protein